MLIRKEQHLGSLGKAPVENLFRITGGADNPAMAPTEALEIRCRIDVGDRGDFSVRVEHCLELLPGFFDQWQTGHIGHRAAGGQIREDGDLILTREDIGHFRHEMNATKDNRACIGLGRFPGEPQGITGEIGMAKHFIALIVMTQDDAVTSKACLAVDDLLVAQRIIQKGVILKGQGGIRHRKEGVYLSKDRSASASV